MTITVPVGFELPVPSTAVEGPIEFTDSGAQVTLVAHFKEGQQRRRTELSFSKVRAYRHRAEAHCTAGHIEGVYDTLVEVTGSDWVNELWRDTPDRLKNKWVLRHFMIYFDSSGCYEIVAGDWSATTLNGW
ncbi:MAG: hypothetical protein ACJ796_07910 [Gemmatimonadaceae bacterium]